MLELLRTISLRHLASSPLRSLLVLFGIALGVATLVATAAVNRSILSSFEQMVERVAGKADLIITHGESGVEEKDEADRIDDFLFRIRKGSVVGCAIEDSTNFNRRPSLLEVLLRHLPSMTLVVEGLEQDSRIFIGID